MLNFRRMQDADQEMVMNWRLQPAIADVMLTEITPDLTRQRRWFASVKDSDKARYWIIEFQGRPVGVINLADIDRINRHATWGIYLGEKMRSPIGGMIPAYFYNHVFSLAELNLHKLYGMVFESNTGIRKMHEICGYRQVGVHLDHVWRHGRFHNVHVVELLREDWLAKGPRFSRYQAHFEP
jgi:UDP-4-amino-4,6-dideoxy-N-acetyl-beta-L-altrosamine N-acetyltransferase